MLSRITILMTLGDAIEMVSGGLPLTSTRDTVNSSSPSTALSMMVSMLKHVVDPIIVPVEKMILRIGADRKSLSFTVERNTKLITRNIMLYIIYTPAVPSCTASATKTSNPTVSEFGLSTMTHTSPDAPSGMGSVSSSLTVATVGSVSNNSDIAILSLTFIIL